MACSYEVTGGGRGVRQAVTERLLRDGGSVVVIEPDEQATAWSAQNHAICVQSECESI